MTHRIYFTPLIACILLTLFASPVFAHEGIEHETELEAEAHLKADATLPMKPLDFIKARAQEIKQTAQGAKVEMRADTKVKLQTASSSGEKRDIMKDAAGARFDIAKDRAEATIKGIIRLHGGVIKNRFHLAIDHMTKLLGRIDTRIDKMTAAGVDTASVVELHASAETAVAKAEADASAVGTFIESVDDSSDRAAVKTELQAKVKTAQASLKAAHEAVIKTVRALVALAKTTKPTNTDASVEASTEAELNM